MYIYIYTHTTYTHTQVVFKSNKNCDIPWNKRCVHLRRVKAAKLKHAS
jgi:hypothetical protein